MQTSDEMTLFWVKSSCLVILQSFTFFLLFNKRALKSKSKVNLTEKRNNYIILSQAAQEGQITLDIGIQSSLCFPQAFEVGFFYIYFIAISIMRITGIKIF